MSDSSPELDKAFRDMEAWYNEDQKEEPDDCTPADFATLEAYIEHEIDTSGPPYQDGYTDGLWDALCMAERFYQDVDDWAAESVTGALKKMKRNAENILDAFDEEYFNTERKTGLEERIRLCNALLHLLDR